MALISKVVNLGETVVSKVASQASQMVQQMPKVQSTPDDNKVLQQIRSAHSPDANLVVDERALLTIAADILQNATATALVDPKDDNYVLIDKANQQAIPEALAFTIHKICCEMSCSCTGGDVKAITLAVFNTLVKYPWDSKVALVLSAFAVSYGEFCLISQLHATNPIAKSVVLLKPLPDISERESLINSVLKVIIDVTNYIIQLMELPSEYHDKPPLSDAIAQIPNAVYWAIRSIVVCASQSTGLINVGHEYVISIAEVRKKLSDISLTLKNIEIYLSHQLTLCHQYIEEQNSNQYYYNLINLFKSTHKDNMEIFKALIQTKDNLPLFDGSNKKKVSLDVLRGKTVILFISYYDISDEEIKDIVQMGWKKERQYEVVWLPIIEGSVESTQIKQEIHRKASLMPWHSLHYSLVLQSAVIKFIKEVWHFEKKPLLVVSDPKGRIVCPNAYHMIMIWGIKAFPFDTQREETLWKETRWSLDFLISDIDSDKEQLVKEGSYIYLYGGDDLDWIKKFTSTVKEVAKASGINIELIYIGKKHTETIIKENISKCWDLQKIRRFKARLESMLYSKMRLGRSIENDTVMKELMMSLSSDGSGEGWTMIGRGFKDMVSVSGKIIIDTFSHIQKFNIKITSESFFSSITNVITELQNSKPRVNKHCNHLVLPNTNGVIPDKMVCVDCNRPMEKYIMYKCCVE